MIYAQTGATFEATAHGFASGLVGTIGVQIVDGQGNVSVARSTTSIVEHPAGSGVYTATRTAPSTAGEYLIVWDSGGALTPNNTAVEGLTVGTTLEALASRLGSGSITVLSPVAQDGTLTLVRGDDYSAVDGRQLDFTDSGSSWPDLTGATVTFTAKYGNATSLTKAGSVVIASGAGKKVRVELTSSETSALLVATHRFDIQATLSSGRKVTLVMGNAIVREDVTTP